MNAKRVFVQALLLGYLGVTLAAFVFTVFRVELLPRRLFWYSYGMMAPYQGYAVENAELRALGLTAAGEWEEIDLYRYIPTGRGEFSYRGYLPSARFSPDQGKAAERYRALAALLHEREPQYGSVALYFDVWPASPGGYEWLRHDPFLTFEFLAAHP